MRRLTVVLARRPTDAAAPPGVAPEAYAAALVEDTYEAVAALAGVEVVVAVPEEPSWRSEVLGLLWPTTRVIGLTTPSAVLAQLAERPAGEPEPEPAVAVLVAPDVPDLPGLILAKVFSALSSTRVAAAPALRGGLTAVGCRLPPPDWLAALDLDLDDPEAERRLRAAAPRRQLRITKPWRRMRSPADVATLDPGLEGWEATRNLLSST